MAKGPSRGTQVFLWLFIVIGMGAIGVGFWTLIKSIRTESWPVTQGVIQSASVQAHSGSKGSTTYSPEIAYVYHIGNVRYDGNKIAVGQMSSSSSYAHEVLKRYPVGKQVSVHYAPSNPAEAVLETGIHGGTWICFGVGTMFVLFGAMFLQIIRAAVKAQLPGAVSDSSIRTNSDGTISMDKPPFLMGVISLLAGVGICFAQSSNGTPQWIIYAAGGMFGMVGLFILFNSLKNKLWSKCATFVAVALFLAIFHWVSFGAGERIGTSTTPFSHRSGVNVKTPFAVLTIFFDAIIVGGVIHRVVKRKKF